MTRSSRRSTLSASKLGGAPAGEKVYGIGESVYVKMEGKHYSGIVKNVDYGSSDEESESGDVMYEVEFSDGEVWDVNPKDMFENEDD